MNDRNTIVVSGEISKVEPIRLTPAGLTVLNFKLTHRSIQKEANTDRKVYAEFHCILIGETEEKLTEIQNHTKIKIKGFIASVNTKAPYRLVLHVTAYELLN